jgi:NAD(P)-dependent dehydrogenase (short-subunit alcohol dehydrogenase family)
MDLGLGGAVALVTGGASGIGAACVRTLSAEGARVVVADVSAEAAASVAAEVGGLAVGGDVRSPEDTVAMVRAAVSEFGRLDVAVNSAGVGVPQKADVHETPLDEWRRVTTINLDGVFLSMRAEIPAMLGRGGAVVNVASIMGAVGSAGSSAYVAAKHGVVGLTRTAALEYAQRGVRVNAVGPGFIDTPLLSHNAPGALAEIAERHPVGRLGTAEEIARATVFLLSPAAAFVTGSYGGYLPH